MRIFALLVGFAVAFSAPAFGQTDSKTWQRIIAVEGDRGEIKNLAVADNGDIVVAGVVTRAGPFRQGMTNDAWLARYTPDGRQLWSRSLGGEYRDEASDLALDKDGTVLIAGARDMRLTQSAQASSSFVARYSPAGDLLWDTVVHDDAREIWLSSILLPGDGSILVSGRDTPKGDGGSRALVAKLDSAGKVQWTFTPPAIAQEAVINTGQLYVRSPDGRVFAFETAGFGQIAGDKTIEIRAGDGDRCFVVAVATGVATDQSCGPAKARDAFSGTISGGFNNGDAVFRKHDAAGGITWARTFATEGGDGVHEVAATPDGGVVGAGFALDGPRVERHNWDGLLIKLDGEGNEVWRRRFGGGRRDELTSVAVLLDGSIVVAGYTGSQSGAADWNPWLMRLNSSGELEGAALAELQQREK